MNCITIFKVVQSIKTLKPLVLAVWVHKDYKNCICRRRRHRRGRPHRRRFCQRQTQLQKSRKLLALSPVCVSE
jgi:hypothetical protein